MASESSTGFHQHNRRGMSTGEAMSGGSRAASGVCEFIPMGNYMIPGGTLRSGDSIGPAEGIVFSSQNFSLDSCTTTFLMDSVPGLKHNTGLATDWSIDEQYKLEEGLARCASEPNILRYIKIAAALRNKTVRDVALRCRWMERKRRKREDLRFGKKEKDLKDKIELSLKNSMSSSVSSLNVAPYFLTLNHHDQVLCGKTKHLLEENYQAFDQISTNLATLKLQQNMDLFSRTRNNLTTILNDMAIMPGIMSQMPPLPVLLDVQLANSILPCSSQALILSSSGAAPVKQEPGC